MTERDGWNYAGTNPKEGEDARKLVTLLEGGMVWVGIRAYHHRNRCWLNNGEPERAEVIAWRDLPQPAEGRYTHGNLFIPLTAAAQEKDKMSRSSGRNIGATIPITTGGGSSSGLAHAAAPQSGDVIFDQGGLGYIVGGSGESPAAAPAQAEQDLSWDHLSSLATALVCTHGISAWVRCEKCEQSPGNGFVASFAQPEGTPETAKQRYNRFMEPGEEPDPIERLRFFCSNAMNGQDWTDSEQFFDAVVAQRNALQAELTDARTIHAGYEVTIHELQSRLDQCKQDGKRYQQLLDDPETGRHLLLLLSQGRGNQESFRKMQDRIKASKDAAINSQQKEQQK